MGRDVTAIAPQLVATISWLVANLQPCAINRTVCSIMASPSIYLRTWSQRSGKCNITKLKCFCFCSGTKAIQLANSASIAKPR